MTDDRKGGIPIVKVCTELEYMPDRENGFRIYFDHSNITQIFALGTDIKYDILQRWVLKVYTYPPLVNLTRLEADNIRDSCRSTFFMRSYAALTAYHVYLMNASCCKRNSRAVFFNILKSGTIAMALAKASFILARAIASAAALEDLPVRRGEMIAWR
jgi:hypothetical protein